MLQEIKIKNMSIYQDTDYQSITLDSLVLADFVKINRNVKKILDIGAGNGIISLILAKKSKAEVFAVEILKKSCELARKNYDLNNVFVELYEGDIKEYSKDKHQLFDVIVSNPPYFVEENEKQIKDNINKKIARNENDLSFKELITISNKLLKNKGHLYLVFRTNRLEEIMGYISKTRLSVKVLKFVYTKENSNALLVLMECIKSSKSGIEIEPPINIYDNNVKRKIYEVIE